MQEGQTRIKGKHAYEHACLRGKRRRQDNGGSFTASDDNSSHARRVTSGACEEEDTREEEDLCVSVRVKYDSRIPSVPPSITPITIFLREIFPRRKKRK